MCTVSFLAPPETSLPVLKKRRICDFHSSHDVKNVWRVCVRDRCRSIWRCKHTSPLPYFTIHSNLFLAEFKLMCEEWPYCFLAFSVYISGQAVDWRMERLGWGCVLLPLHWSSVIQKTFSREQRIRKGIWLSNKTSTDTKDFISTPTPPPWQRVIISCRVFSTVCLTPSVILNKYLHQQVSIPVKDALWPRDQTISWASNDCLHQPMYQPWKCSLSGTLASGRTRKLALCWLWWLEFLRKDGAFSHQESPSSAFFGPDQRTMYVFWFGGNFSFTLQFCE